MVHLIRNNTPYTVILLLIFTLVVKVQVLSHPVLPSVDNGHIIYASFVHLLDILFRGHAFIYTLLSVLMVYGQAIYLNAIAAKHKLFAKPTYVVAYVYILLTSLYPPFNHFSEPLLTNWLIIASIDFVLGTYQTNQPRKHLFNMAFVLGCTAIISFPAVIYFILLLSALLLLRSFSPGEWIVAIMGYLTPFYFFAGILFLTDKINYFTIWPSLGLSLPHKIAHPVYLIGTLVCMVSMFAFGVLSLQPYLTKASIFIRRNWTTLTIFLFTTVIASLGQNAAEGSAWLLVMPLLSIFISNVFYSEKNKGFSTFVFYFSLATLAFCLFTYK